MYVPMIMLNHVCWSIFHLLLQCMKRYGEFVLIRIIILCGRLTSQCNVYIRTSVYPVFVMSTLWSPGYLAKPSTSITYCKASAVHRKECSWMGPIHGHCIVMLRCKLITIELSFIRRSLSVFGQWGSLVHQTHHAVITLTIHYDQQLHAAIIQYIPQQTLKSRAIKGKERGVAVSRVLAAQARGPGFDPQQHHLSFFPFAVSKVYRH